jgi:uncharacterized protein YlxP (DUF503 family)
MVIGTLTVSLRIRESRSLKDKRQVVRSIQDRLRNQFHVAISEVDSHDDVQLIELGIAAVGHEVSAIKGLLQTIQEALRGHPIAEYCQGEIIVGHEVV